MDDDGAPLQPRSYAKRNQTRSRMTMVGTDTQYKPKRRTVVHLLSRANKRQESMVQNPTIAERRIAFEKDKNEDDSDEDDDEDHSSSEDSALAPKEREAHHRGAMTDEDFSKAVRAATGQQNIRGLPQDNGFFDARDTDRLGRLLKEFGEGSVLRGWRRKYDVEGSLQVSFVNFVNVSVDIGFAKRKDDLYSMPREFTNITLVHVNPALGGLVEAFRQWIHLRYHGHAVFYDAFDTEHKNKILADDFIKTCQIEGFSASEYELSELFSCCDWEGRGEITRDDVVYLENDNAVKERELTQIKRRKQYEFDKVLVESYTQELASGLPPAHRQAIRPWVAKKFEEMPEIQRQVKVVNEKSRVKKGLKARLAFMRKIRALHGNEVTAWRRVLDVDATFLVSEGRFRQICRQLDFNDDINALWYSLDPDHDGTLSLEQLSPQAAILLASFRSWVVESFGSCVALWESRESIARRKKKSVHRADGVLLINHMSLAAFAQVLKSCECPLFYGETGKTAQRFICRSLDFGGGGFINRSDLEWLDKWTPSEWLTAEPDAEAWQELNTVLIDKFGHILKAWRFFLDADNSTRLSWIEFRDSCDRLKFNGRVGAAWRWLDKDLVGWISLAAVDEESSNILHSFKDWAETRFGSLKCALKAIAGSNNNLLNRHDLRISCNKFKWSGNSRLLFDMFTKNGDTICLKDVEFLSTWTAVDYDNIRLLKATTDALWKELLEGRSAAQKKKSTLAVSEGMSAELARPGSGGVTLSRPSSVTSVLELLNSTVRPESSLHNQSTVSISESMYSLPDSHCSPCPAFVGAPYARPVTCRPVVSPMVTVPETMRRLIKSSSQPPRTKSGGLATKGGSLNARMGSFLKAPGPLRKRDLVGSVGVGLPADASMVNDLHNMTI